MFKEISILSILVALCVGEVPVSGPYPPSGWKPQGSPFTLPKDFLPQQQRQGQQQQAAPKAEVEVTQERVEYAGQIGDSTTTSEPNNSYLPPDTDDDGDDVTDENSTEDYLRVQGLPSNQPSAFNRPKSGQLNRGEFIAPQARGQYRIQTNRQFGQIRVQPQQQQQPQFGRQTAPLPQFGRQVAPLPPFGKQTAPAQPAQEYGPPQPNNSNVEPSPAVDEDSEEENEEDNSNEEPTIAVSNSVSNGQYYILTPDNTLQRVVFMTSQNTEEARTNGFTAELRYMPVEPIRDPIYAYNTDGQLIRIFNKK